MGVLTGLLYACLGVFAAGWYFNKWSGNFSLLLFVLSLVTFGYWLAERFYFAPQRRRAVVAFEAQDAARREQLARQGITRVDDAKRAAEAGVTAISVSNHGGNNLDGTPAPIRALPAIADAVGDHVEILLDGGIRRGSDVVKALALGARAVMIGRAYLWGLAANGQAGVENVLDIVRGGIDSALLALGRSSIDELTPEDLLIPDGFSRALGCETSKRAEPASPT